MKEIISYVLMFCFLVVFVTIWGLSQANEATLPVVTPVSKQHSDYIRTVIQLHDCKYELDQARNKIENEAKKLEICEKHLYKCWDTDD